MNGDWVRGGGGGGGGGVWMGRCSAHRGAEKRTEKDFFTHPLGRGAFQAEANGPAFDRQRVLAPCVLPDPGAVFGYSMLITRACNDFDDIVQSKSFAFTH